jgi:hypothetical protein
MRDEFDPATIAAMVRKNRILAIAGVLTFAALGTFGLLMYRSTPPKADQAAAEPVAVEVEDNAKLGKMLDATLQTFSADKVCYDRLNRYYFVHAAPHKKNEKWWDEGWYPMASYDFKLLENGTYVLVKYVMTEQIYPDVTGLTCKEQKADPEWFKD